MTKLDEANEALEAGELRSATPMPEVNQGFMPQYPDLATAMERMLTLEHEHRDASTDLTLETVPDSGAYDSGYGIGYENGFATGFHAALNILRRTVKYSRESCCEASNRLETVPMTPGGDTTLLGWRCPLHGTTTYAKVAP
jgi:hypothetical protein